MVCYFLLNDQIDLLVQGDIIGLFSVVYLKYFFAITLFQQVSKVHLWSKENNTKKL